MNYKEVLYFVGRSLLISKDQQAFAFILKTINAHKVDWEKVIQVSTSHYVLPAIFFNFKRKNLLTKLPDDLVSFMEHITHLNRDRNLQIIQQAKEISMLLVDHNITPIFLKGTGNLLDGLYENISERMVGDIDFIVAPDDQLRAFQILEEAGYKKVHKRNLSGRHFPRIVKSGEVAAVEVHQYVVKEPYENELSFDLLQHNVNKYDSFYTLSDENKLCLSIIATQINDDGQYFKNISLRNAYDVFLISRKVDALASIQKLPTLLNPLNQFLALCNEVLTSDISYQPNEKTEEYLNEFHRLLSDKPYRMKFRRKWSRKLWIQRRVKIIRRSFTQKEYRSWLLKTVTSTHWLKKKFGLG